MQEQSDLHYKEAAPVVQEYVRAARLSALTFNGHSALMAVFITGSTFHEDDGGGRPFNEHTGHSFCTWPEDLLDAHMGAIMDVSRQSMSRAALRCAALWVSRSCMQDVQAAPGLSMPIT